MANPFLTLPSFGADSASQSSFFDGLKTILNDLETKTPIIIESTTIPTQVQMETAYLAATVGNTLPVPTSQEFIWTNQGVVQGEYRAVDDLYTNINDVSIARSVSLSGFAFLMANGDIINSGQTDYSNSVTTTLKKWDRRTGLLQALALTMDMPVNQFYMNPAGTQIVFTRLDGGSKRQVYTVPYPALTPISVLTSTTTDCRNPCWQGTKISYLESVGGNWSIMIMDDTGANKTTVLATGVAVANNMHQFLSPDVTKIIYTKYASNNTEIWKVNVNGTSNAKFVNPLDYVSDNPDGGPTTSAPGDLGSMVIPNWSADSLWVLYGRRRKNINTNVSERWFNYDQTADNNRFDDTNTYYDSINMASKDWFTKNISTSLQLYGGSPLSPESIYIYLPTFTVPIYGGKAYLIANMTYPNITSTIQMMPAMLAANQADGYKSTGKIYKTSQYVPDRGDFELIRQDVCVGGETTFSVSKTELQNFDHIQIVFEGTNTTTAGINAKILINEDNTAGNYHNVALLINTTILRMYSFGTDAFIFNISPTGGSNISQAIMTLFDIQSTDNFKTLFNEVTYDVVNTSLSISNYFHGDVLGTWKSTAAVESLRFVASAGLSAGTVISYYGIRGTVRSDKDV